MELVIQILMLFILIACTIKLSFWKWWQSLIFGLLCATFIVWGYEYAILQSKTQIADYLNNAVMKQNMAVVITLEAALGIAFCITSLKQLTGKRKQRWMSILHFYPSLLIFPTLFYVLTQFIFNLSGTSFSVTAYSLAIVIAISLPLLSRLFALLFNEYEFRLEIYFLVSLFIAIMGLITTASSDVVYVTTKQTFNLKAIGLALAIFSFAFALGYVWNRKKWSIKKKLKNKWK